MEEESFQKEYIDVMAVDNLPCELAKDASEYFGNEFINEILHFCSPCWSSQRHPTFIIKPGKTYGTNGT